MRTTRYCRFLAASLIVGESSPILKNLSIYQSSFWKKKLKESQNLKIVELRGVSGGTRPDIKRRLIFPSNNLLETSNTLANGIAQVVTFVDREHRVCISDSIFNDEEFTYNKNMWHKTLASRVDMMITLIHILQVEQKEDLPLLINDFPNIAGVFIMHPEVLEKGITGVRKN